jgi:4-hydroxybenzoate polyprenyltransferase
MLADTIIMTRFPSVVAGGVEALLGAYLTVERLSGTATLAACAMASSVAAAMVLNDIVDIEVDAVAKAGRPLPAGRWSVRSAWLLTSLLSFTAVVCATWTGLAAGLATAVLLAVSALYSYRLKSTVVVGNVVVALCSATPVVFGALVVGSPGRRVGIAAILVFGFMFAYEITKDISDGRSDAQSNIRTIATVHHPQVSLKLLRSVLAVLAVGAGAATLGSEHPRVYVTLIVAFLLPATYTVWALADHTDPAALKRAVTAMRTAWVIGSLALWCL